MKRLTRLIRSDTGKMMAPSFAVAFAGRLMQLAMAVLAARILLPEAYGNFIFAYGVGAMGGRIGALGWPMLMNRYIPRYKVDGEWGLMRGLVRAAHGVVLVSGIIVGGLIVLLGIWVGPDSQVYLGLVLGGIMLPVLAFGALYRNMLAALRSPQGGIFIDELFPATLMCVALVFLLGHSIEPEVAISMYLVSSTIGLVVGAVWIRRKLPAELADAKPEYLLGSWIRTALPGMVGTSSKLLMNKSDVLMLAPLSTMTAVGVYGAALRMTAVQTVPVGVISTVITARISEAFAAGRDTQGKRLFYGALIFAMAFAGSVAGLVILFAEFFITLLFGEAYAGGAAVLSILAIAQIGAAINTPTSSFMLMTGREGAFGRFTAIALALNIGLNFWLIPLMGASGAAIATCASIWLLTGLQLLSCLAIIRSGAFKDKPNS
jgi:O-antigen/teichoic acid export membrane protein